MIIKSMSRKAPTFGQLAAYISQGSEDRSGNAFIRNLYASGDDRAEIVGQFFDNYRYLPERKGGNALYHEVIVLEPQPHLAPERVEAALHDLAERYCERRAPHQLAWGRVHHETEFPHIHLMISANAVRSDRRVRMDRSYFATVQRDLERWRAEQLPELRARVIYGRENEKQTPKQPVQEGEMVRRTQSPSRKQVVYNQVKSAIEKAADQADVERCINEVGLGIYKRGQTFGVTDRTTGKRYRLKNLGLDTAFAALSRTRSDDAEPHGKSTDNRADQLLRQRMETAARDQLRGGKRDGPERN